MGIAAHIGQVGKYEATGEYIDTLGATFTGARTAQTAVTDGDLADSDEKTLTIYSGTSGEPSANVLWWRATWNNSSTRWERVSELGSIGTISDEDDVSVWVVSGVPDLPSVSDSKEYAMLDGAWAESKNGALTQQNDTVTTSNVTAVEGKWHRETIAGLTASRNFTLPAPSAAGKRLRVSIVDGDDTYAMILIGDTGVSINSGTAATEETRLFQKKESMLFESTSTSNWDVVDDGRIPCVLTMDKVGGSDETLTDGVTQQVEFENAVYDPASMHEPTNDVCLPRRTGLYRAEGAVTLTVSSGSNTAVILVGISIDGGSTILWGPYTTPDNVTQWRTGSIFRPVEFDLDTDTSIGFYINVDISAGTAKVENVGNSSVTVTEVLS